jgi:hypothetical protein
LGYEADDLLLRLRMSGAILPLPQYDLMMFIRTTLPFYNDKGKRKSTLEQAMKAQRGVEVQLYPFLDPCPRWGGLLIP